MDKTALACRAVVAALKFAGVDADRAAVERVVRARVTAGDTWPQVFMALVAELHDELDPADVPKAEDALLPLYHLALADPYVPAKEITA